MSSPISLSTYSMPLRLTPPHGKTLPQTAAGQGATQAFSGADKTRVSDAAGAALKAVTEQSEAGRAMAKSMKAARDEARSAVKTRAMADVERLKEEFKLIRKLWAHDPKEMARQLGRLAKQLKQALASYAEAAKANGERVRAEPAPIAPATPASSASPDAQADNGARDAGRDVQAAEKSEPAAPDGKHATDRDSEPAAVPQVRASAFLAALAAAQAEDRVDAVSAYERQSHPATHKTDIAGVATPVSAEAEVRRLERESAEMEARGDLTFAADVRGFVKKLRETLQEAKIKSAFERADEKARNEAFKATEDVLSEIDEDVADMEADIKDAFPELTTGIAPVVTGAAA